MYLGPGGVYVAVSVRLALWSHLAGQVLASPVGGRDSIAPAWPQQFAPHQQSVRRVPAM